MNTPNMIARSTSDLGTMSAVSGPNQSAMSGPDMSVPSGQDRRVPMSSLGVSVQSVTYRRESDRNGRNKVGPSSDLACKLLGGLEASVSYCLRYALCEYGM
jgi:hypothetical protein